MNQKQLIENGVYNILEALEGPEDLTLGFRDGISKTPVRVAKAYIDEIFSGYDVDPASLLATTFESEPVDEMVIVRNIPVYSMCEHHILPFIGKAHVAYLPANNRIVGISKLARVVNAYARRLQVQERLTQQVANTIDNVLMPKGVAVMMSCEHLCMTMRGVQSYGTQTITSCLLGVFRKPEVREEFFRLVAIGDSA